MTTAYHNELQVLGIEFQGFHGVYEEERRDGSLFNVDLIAHVGPLEGYLTDRLSDTVDYTRLADIIHEHAHGPPCHLLEHLGEKIASSCLELPGVNRVDITIRKRPMNVAGDPRWVAVRVVRGRAAV